MQQAVALSSDIIIGGTRVILDPERLDVVSEVPRLDVSPEIRSERDLVKRRELYMDWIDRRIEQGIVPPVSATSVAVEDEEWKVLTLMISAHQEITEGKVLPAQRLPIQELRVTLATWSGLPLSDKRLFRSGGAHLKGVKIGMRALDGKEAQQWERRGGSINIYRDYGARFDVDLVDGRRLLDLYGWRLSSHKECWWLYEVGGPLEPDIARWLDDVAGTQSMPELAERARIICPAAFGAAAVDDEPAARRRGR